MVCIFLATQKCLKPSGPAEHSPLGVKAVGRVQNSGKSSSVHNSFTRVVCFADGFQRAKRETVYVCCERERARKERQCEKREHRRQRLA